MSLFDFLSGFRTRATETTRIQELGGYTSYFSNFGSDIYASDLVRDCIRPLAEHTSKANARCSNKNIERILNISPNIYMNGKDFLAKVRTRLELTNTVFILVNRDEMGKVVGFYPIPHQAFEALEMNGDLIIHFTFSGQTRDLYAFWDDLIVLRKDYNNHDIAGDKNDALFSTLKLVTTANEGLGNSIKSTSNLRGILKSTKAMISPKDLKATRDAFVKDYLTIANSSGVASLDSTTDFVPIQLNPATASYTQMKELRENVYRYFGVNDAIVTSNYTESQMEAFYEARIEPVLIALSEEMTRKVFSEREIAFGAHITYESNRMQYASMKTKLGMVALVDRGLLTPNEFRLSMNLAPYDGGDEFMLRKDTATTGNVSSGSSKKKDDESEDDDNDNEE